MSLKDLSLREKIIVGLFAVGIIAVVLALAMGGFYHFFYFPEIDENLKEMAAKHPQGEKLLQVIQESQRKLKDLDPKNDYEALQNIAFNFNALGDKQGAIEYYKKALGLVSIDAVVLSNLAHILQDIGEYEEAEKYYLEIFHKKPTWIMVYRDLGDLYRYRMPEKEKEIPELFVWGLKFNPEHPDLLTYLAGWYSEKGNKEAALQYYERALKIMPLNEAVKREIQDLKDELGIKD